MTTSLDPIGTTVPSWEQIIIDAITGALANAHQGLPARVLSFDPSTQSASVQPLLKRVILNDDESHVVLSYPPIDNVPICYPAGAGWSITWPLAVDDIVFLTFAERSLDRWLSAPVGQEVDPLDVRQFDLSDAVAIPGIRPRTRPLPNIAADTMHIGREDGTVDIQLTSSGIRILGSQTVTVAAPNIFIGDTADSPIPRGTELLAWLASHVHPTAALGPPSPPTVPPPPTLLSAGAKVK